MSFSLLSLPSSFIPFSSPHLRLHPPHKTLTLTSATAHPSPSDDDPPEAPEDSSHGVPRLHQFQRQVARARRVQQSQFLADQPIFVAALSSEKDPPSNPTSSPTPDPDDPFGDIDRAISLQRQQFVSQGLLPPNPPKDDNPDDHLQDTTPLSLEEARDIQEIQEIQENNNVGGIDTIETMKGEDGFELDLERLRNEPERILDPKFQITLAELLDESRVVPVSVYGDLDVDIGGIQYDPKEVNAGDLFICCAGEDSAVYLTEAGKRGAVAVVADEEINVEEALGCKALVIVEDARMVLAVLAGSFYRNPSRGLSVIGVVGTEGRTTVTHLVKAMYEAMGLRTGMLGSLGCYIHGGNKVEGLEMAPDAVMVQKLMAKMLHNGTEAVVMEAEGSGNGCSEIDFDIAVFTNLSKDHPDFSGSDEEYRRSESKLFGKMLDPDRHRKVVNIDDPNAAYFIAQGNQDVPVVTFAMENKNADVHPLKFELTLFETQVLVQTPQGVLEISSGLLGRHNIYNILAAVAVGIAVGAPLEDIVRGVEEVDGVPGRCELIDEEQAFGVIVDYAHTAEGLSRLLDTARELGPKRIITAFGCGGEKDRGKRPLMTKIATEKSDVVILTSDNPRNEDPLNILDDMLAGVGWTMQDYLKYGENDYYPPLPNGHRLFLHDIRRVAVRAAVAMGEEGDIVIVAGKGHETYQIEGDKKEFFDDREECREALHYVDELHQAGIDTSEFPWRLPESH